MERRRLARLVVLGAAVAMGLTPPAHPARAEGHDKGEKGEKGEGGANGGRTFVPLGDVIVNLPRSGARPQMAVIDVMVETKPEANSAIKNMAPRLREAALFELMSLARRHMLDADTVDPLAVKDALFEALSKLHIDGFKDVLIQRILHS